jgi:hypothetical protein
VDDDGEFVSEIRLSFYGQEITEYLGELWQDIDTQNLWAPSDPGCCVVATRSGRQCAK